MMVTTKRWIAACALALACPLSQAEVQQIWSAAGTSPAAIQAAVDGLRNDLGTLNPPAPGSVGSGRREINWDANPLDNFASPATMPATFFNRPFAPVARGTAFLTNGLGVRVSQDDNDDTTSDDDQLRFSDLNAQYLDEFQAFSEPRLFSTGTDDNVMDILFFVPGTESPARVTGFGAIFTDVDTAGETFMEFFDVDGDLLHVQDVAHLSGQGSLSVLGVVFDEAELARVRITAGNARLGADDNPPASDVVAIDDFIFGEPIAIVPDGNPRTTVKQVWSAGGATPADIQTAVDGLRSDLGELNAPVPGSVGSGRREINWDANPLDNFATPATMPATFFNRPAAPVARGAVFLTTGLGVRVSQDDNDDTTPDDDQLRFSDLNPEYLEEFTAFSEPRLFSPGADANIVDILFFVPGTKQPALVSGFGALFTGVEQNGSATMVFYDRRGNILFTESPLSGQVSILGAVFEQAQVARVRIVSGNLLLGESDSGTARLSTRGGAADDVVALDDFIFGEPISADLLFEDDFEAGF